MPDQKVMKVGKELGDPRWKWACGRVRWYGKEF